MATKLVPVTDPSLIYDLWEAGLLCGAYGNCGTPLGYLSKEWYVNNWTIKGVPGGPYGYYLEE